MTPRPPACARCHQAPAVPDSDRCEPCQGVLVQALDPEEQTLWAGLREALRTYPEPVALRERGE
jgi:hypothetical protein